MVQSTCNKCGQPIEGTPKFCPECGNPLTGQAAVSKPGESEVTKAPKTQVRDSLIVIGVLAVVTIAFFILKDKGERPVNPEGQTASTNPHAGAMPRDVLDNLPTDYQGLVDAGNDFYDQGAFAVAAECYSRALEIDSHSPDVRTDYGACLYAMGLPDRAEDEFREVIRTHPEHTIANFNLGIVFHSVKQDDSARFYWEKYLKLDPNGAPAETAREMLKELGG